MFVYMLNIVKFNGLRKFTDLFVGCKNIKEAPSFPLLMKS